jgi:uncharacterized protein YndB with AHSA1/START domain
LPRNQRSGGNGGLEGGRSVPAEAGHGAQREDAMSERRVTIERTVFVDASPETIFGYLVDPALMAQWIGAFHTLDARPGGVFRVQFESGNTALGAFTEVTPYRRVAFTWGWESAESSLASLKPGGSLVEIELEEHKGGTLLRLRHSELPEDQAPCFGEHWSDYLGILAGHFASKEQAAGQKS